MFYSPTRARSEYKSDTQYREGWFLAQRGQPFFSNKCSVNARWLRGNSTNRNNGSPYTGPYKLTQMLIRFHCDFLINAVIENGAKKTTCSLNRNRLQSKPVQRKNFRYVEHNNKILQRKTIGVFTCVIVCVPGIISRASVGSLLVLGSGNFLGRKGIFNERRWRPWLLAILLLVLLPSLESSLLETGSPC